MLFLGIPMVLPNRLPDFYDSSRGLACYQYWKNPFKEIIPRKSIRHFSSNIGQLRPHTFPCIRKIPPLAFFQLICNILQPKYLQKNTSGHPFFSLRNLKINLKNFSCFTSSNPATKRVVDKFAAYNLKEIDKRSQGC